MPSKISLHPRNKIVAGRNQIMGIGKHKYYIRGLLKPLKRVFYKNFKRPPYAMANSSIKLGLRVHKEVENWAKGKPAKRPHRFTKQILASLKELNLIPVDPEVAVLSYDGAFLTRSDLICRHIDKDDTVIVSLKTGGSLGYTKHQGDLTHLKGLKSCVKYHHQMQLACEVSCVEQEYKIPVANAFVIYAGFGKKKAAKVDSLLPIFKTARVRKAINHALLSDAANSRDCLPYLVVG